MSQNRAISKASPVSGATFTADAADTVNYLSSLSGGVGVTPAGTNAYTMDLDVDTGFSGPSGGMQLSFKIPNTNTGACTINIEGTGAKALVQVNGDAFVGGELVAGTLVTCLFLGGADDEWRLISARSAGSSNNFPLLNVDVFDAPGVDTWTAPWDCDALFICIGAGGGGRATQDNTAPGGGAGGFCDKFIQGISSGDEAAIVVGEGGARAVVSIGNADGGDGGTSSVTSTDFTIGLSAGGGTGGGAGGAGAGGAATGGDNNHTGGDGGTTGGKAAGGGGAVGVFGDGNDGQSGAVAGYGATCAPGSIRVHPWLNTLGAGGDGDATGGQGNAGDPLCGGGGATVNAGSATDTFGGNGGTGAGGGGAACSSGAGSDAYSGFGGDGLVMVIYTNNKAA